VKFHNGDNFTASDVKFTIERIITEGAIEAQSSPRKSLLGPISGVEIVDDYTVLIKTSEPWAILPTMLTFHEIVPKDYVEKKGSRYFAQHPVGAGPFKFIKWIKGERIVLERFDEYYGGAPDIEPVSVAKVKTLIFKPIPEPASRLAALKAGECSIIQDLPPHLVESLKNDVKIKVLTAEGTRSYFVGLNCTKKPFKDVRVRQAMNHAVNIEQIIDSILEGMARWLIGPLVPGCFGYNEALNPYQYDPEKARRLLKEAGYPNGFEVELDTDSDLKEVAEAIANQLADIGVKAKVRVWEWGVLKPQLDANERHMFISSWGNASLDPVDILLPTLRSGGAGNYTGYSNSKVDELLDRASVEMDLNLRAELFREAQALIHQDAPWIFGYSLKEIHAARQEVENWQPRPDGMLHMHDVFIGI
jgi:peptide/nickel transport system substrate-binding protein